MKNAQNANIEKNDLRLHIVESPLKVGYESSWWYLCARNRCFDNTTLVCKYKGRVLEALDQRGLRGEAHTGLLEIPVNEIVDVV